jgi:hypothetical protein
MAVDEELLARSDAENEENGESDESEMAGDFRAARRDRGDLLEDDDTSVRSLRQSALMRQKAEKDKADSEASRASTSPMRQATDKLLQAAWENLIDSFGLTLIWIDIHVFLNKVLGPKVFCDLGDEWLPAEAKKVLAKSDNAKSSVALIEKAEEIGCGCLNLGCLFILVAIFALFAFIAQAIAHPFDTLYQLIKTTFSSFFDLF